MTDQSRFMLTANGAELVAQVLAGPSKRVPGNTTTQETPPA